MGVKVEVHRSTIPSDSNNQLDIEAHEPGAGKAFTKYNVTRKGVPIVDLVFQRHERYGITNEALLAILRHRLTMFQSGPMSCPENDVALNHIHRALTVLKTRTARMYMEKGEKTAAEVAEEAKPKDRVRIEGDILHIDYVPMKLAMVREQWKPWTAIEKAIKMLEPPITPEEMAVIESCATSSAAKNGLAEMKSALASTKKV